MRWNFHPSWLLLASLGFLGFVEPAMFLFFTFAMFGVTPRHPGPRSSAPYAA